MTGQAAPRAGISKILPWLPVAQDFPESCRQVAEGVGDCGDALRALATHAFADAQLMRLSKLMEGLQAKGRSFEPLTPFRLGVIGHGTLDLVAPALTATAARHGIHLECILSDYGQALQDALSPDSKVNRARCDAVLLALDYRGLPLSASPAAPDQAEASVTESLALVRSMQDAIKRNSGARCIVQTLAVPPEALFGSFDRIVPGTLRHTIEAFNLALGLELQGGSATLLDVAALAQGAGLNEWHSPTQWNMAKLPFSLDYLPLYADHVCRVIGALRGKSRRVLVLDLDNTIWGGVIGDDGLDGIVLGEGDSTGEAFLSVQRLALSLRERGVILAVSSKNTDAVARRAFSEHPDMLLREDHIAVFQANWDDKATNIKAIADELSLHPSALVFLDDNPSERAFVRRFLPEVAVPELPDDPALYARTLAAAGYFEAVSFSDEDRRRAEFYQGNSRRTALGRVIGDVAGYLAALEMKATFGPFDDVNRARICQLINKSNQFNLTTRRYTEDEIGILENDDDVFTLQVRLRDRFGDNGLISVIICRQDRSTWFIDTWLMSCRVLGRGVERMVLDHLIGQAREQGITTLAGAYRPSRRNEIVRDHYQKLGFQQRDCKPDGETTWEMSTTAAPSTRSADLGSGCAGTDAR